MRISVENGASHFQARTVQRFAELVARRSEGALLVEFYDGARLFRDADVVAALGRGDVEMAVPGIWQFDKAVPETAVLMLPSAYARPIGLMRRLADGPLGAALGERISATVGARVIGRWLDLGYAHLFASKPIGRIEDLRGVTVRVAGGRANEERMRALGAEPVAISQKDLPAYLDRGLVGAVLTTFETVASAGLDGHGLKAAFVDSEYYPFYIPLVASSFWERLSPALRKTIAEAWEELLPAAREESTRAQEAARAGLAARGMRIGAPSAAETEAIRRELVAREDGMAGRLGVPERMLSLLRDEIGASSR